MRMQDSSTSTLLRGGSFLGDVSVPTAELEGVLAALEWALMLAPHPYASWSGLLGRTVVRAESDFFGEL